MIPVAQMVANDVADALGIRIKRLHVTTEKIDIAIKAGVKEVE